jgi:hypothetical protein
MTLWLLCALPSLRGGTSFFIKCKEFNIKTLSGFGISNLGHCNLFAICDLLFGIYIHCSINTALTTADQSVKALIQQPAPGDRSRCDQTAR